MSGRTFKNFKVPKEYLKSLNKTLIKLNKKRARRADYVLLLGFESE